MRGFLCSVRGREFYVVAETLKFGDGAPAGASGVVAVVVVRAELVVDLAGDEHVPDRDEHGVLGRYECAHWSAPGGQALVACLQVGAVRAGHGRDAEASLGVGVPGPGFGGLRLTG